jgi:hypothetical protein
LQGRIAGKDKRMIDPDNYGLVEMAFVGAVVLGFAVWQLVSVNREIAKDRAKSEDSAGHAVGEHRLDDR